MVSFFVSKRKLYALPYNHNESSLPLIKSNAASLMEPLKNKFNVQALSLLDDNNNMLKSFS